jgi:polynucleotide 5'-kinase involved in rRNA processing
MTKVVNIKTYEGDYIPIDRTTQWGNPFKDDDREENIRKYEEWIRGNKLLMLDLPKLEGEVLGCHCKPKKCHGDILVKLLEEIEK